MTDAQYDSNAGAGSVLSEVGCLEEYGICQDACFIECVERMARVMYKTCSRCGVLDGRVLCESYGGRICTALERVVQGEKREVCRMLGDTRGELKCSTRGHGKSVCLCVL